MIRIHCLKHQAEVWSGGNYAKSLHCTSISGCTVCAGCTTCKTVKSRKMSLERKLRIQIR